MVGRREKAEHPLLDSLEHLGNPDHHRRSAACAFGLDGNAGGRNLHLHLQHLRGWPSVVQLLRHRAAQQHTFLPDTRCRMARARAAERDREGGHMVARTALFRSDTGHRVRRVAPGPRHGLSAQRFDTRQTPPVCGVQEPASECLCTGRSRRPIRRTRRRSRIKAGRRTGARRRNAQSPRGGALRRAPFPARQTVQPDRAGA